MPEQWYLLTKSRNFNEPVLQHMNEIEITAEKRKMLVKKSLANKPQTQKKLVTEIVDMPRQIRTFPAAAAGAGIITVSALPCALLLLLL